MMPEFDDLTDEEVEKILRELADFEQGHWGLCRRKSLYSVTLPNDVTYLCGIHTELFDEDEIEMYDGHETCMAVVID